MPPKGVMLSSEAYYILCELLNSPKLSTEEFMALSCFLHRYEMEEDSTYNQEYGFGV